MIDPPSSPPREEDKLSKKVKDLLRRRKSDRAIRIIEDSISRSPEDWYPTYLLGWAFEELGRHDEALESYRRAETLAPWNEQLKAAICQLLVRTKRAAEALPYAEAMIRTWPSSSEARSLHGKALLDLGRRDEAEKALLMAVQLSDDNPDARAELARLYEEAGREHLIPPLLEAYLQSAPMLASSHAFWAKFQFHELGNFQAALPHYEKALLLYLETNRPAYFRQYFSTAGYPESIIYEYLEALVDCGLVHTAHNIAASHLSPLEFEGFRASYLEQLGDTDEAITKIEKALKSEPRSHYWLHRLATLRLQKREFSEAEALARKAVEETSDTTDNDPWFRAVQIVALVHQGKQAEADALRQAFSKGDRERLEVALIDQYARLSAWEQVISMSEALLEKNSKIIPVMVRLSEALVATGRYESAIRRYQALVQMQPDNPSLWLALARAQIKYGDQKTAKSSLDHAIRVSPTTGTLRQGAERLLGELTRQN